MPLYEYECSKCDGSFEWVMSISKRDDPCNEACPSCLSEGTIKKIITKSTLVDPIIVNASSKIDPGLRNTLDKMKGHNPGMKWDLGN